MANVKISALTADTAPTADDLVVTVNDPGGTPATKKATITDFTKAIPAVIGDSGSGGTKGLVPAPGAGDAAANKFLHADGTFKAPTGSGSIGGSTGATDNRALRADGTGGATLQSSNLTIPDDAATTEVGYLNIPQNSQSAAYTTVIADRGKHILHPSTDANARTFTIDSNANVAYAIGTAITFINMTSQVVTIAITSDTMYLAGTGTTGSRSLAQYGVATAIKIDSTHWIISGTGLT